MREGWRGLVEGLFEPLGPREVSGILPRGGTILGTSRTNPYKVDGGVDKVLATLRRRDGLDALVAIGGEDTLGVAARLHAEHGFPVVGVPKTIDNDLSGDRLHVRLRHRGLDRDRGDRPPAHDGRVAQPRDGRRGDGPPHRLDRRALSGIAGGADVILIPEQPLTVEEACARDRAAATRRGKDFSIVVVSEGYELTYDSGEKRLVAGEARATDQFGHVVLGGVGDALAPRDRGADRLRDARHRARPRPARRHPHPARPRARDALRAQGRRPRRTRARSAAWPRCTATRSSTSRSTRRRRS